MRLRPVLLSVLCVAASAAASDILLNDGQAYHNVTILSRDATTVRVQVKYGVVTFAMRDVESIDGGRAPRPAPAPALPPVARPQPIQLPDAHNWRMDGFLVLWLVVAGAWTWMVLWVQTDAHGAAAEIRRTNALVLLLPGVGWLIYLVQRRHRQASTTISTTLTGRVAGLSEEEAPKKRGLFGTRTKLKPGFTGKTDGLGMVFIDANHNPIEFKQDMPEMTGIEAAHDVLEQALIQRASDIHIEPGNEGCRVRFRIDGVMQERLTFELADGLRVSSALKALAELDVAEKRRAQDGRFRVRTKLGEVDFRLATTNSIHGEKIVLRILDRQSGVRKLSDIGMAPAMMAEFDKVIHSRNGIILVTGPTGSGKTSTLYAALSQLDASKLNIMSIEDPVEYELAGATQMPVNVKAGITYEAGLRSILRQDPDVIFIGEMRDIEAAKVAVRAALTGHLVFSSLHSKDGLSTLSRLTEMGVEQYQIPATLLMVVGQRLVRVLCPHCRKPVTATGTELNEVGLVLPAGQQIYQAQGCDKCEGAGYKGRTAIFELLVLSDRLRRAITENASPSQLLDLAIQQGYRSYRDDGLAKILSGITTVEEVIQAS